MGMGTNLCFRAALLDKEIFVAQDLCWLRFMLVRIFLGFVSEMLARTVPVIAHKFTIPKAVCE